MSSSRVLLRASSLGAGAATTAAAVPLGPACSLAPAAAASTTAAGGAWASWGANEGACGEGIASGSPRGSWGSSTGSSFTSALPIDDAGLFWAVGPPMARVHGMLGFVFTLRTEIPMIAPRSGRGRLNIARYGPRGSGSGPWPSGAANPRRPHSCGGAEGVPTGRRH